MNWFKKVPLSAELSSVTVFEMLMLVIKYIYTVPCELLSPNAAGFHIPNETRC